MLVFPNSSKDQLCLSRLWPGQCRGGWGWPQADLSLLPSQLPQQVQGPILLCGVPLAFLQSCHSPLPPLPGSFRESLAFGRALTGPVWPCRDCGVASVDGEVCGEGGGGGEHLGSVASAASHPHLA